MWALQTVMAFRRIFKMIIPAICHLSLNKCVYNALILYWVLRYEKPDFCDDTIDAISKFQSGDDITTNHLTTYQSFQLTVYILTGHDQLAV